MEEDIEGVEQVSNQISRTVTGHDDNKSSAGKSTLLNDELKQDGASISGNFAKNKVFGSITRCYTIIKLERKSKTESENKVDDSQGALAIEDPECL